MAVSIEELFAQKEARSEGKKKHFDLVTSAGTMEVKLPSRALVAEALKVEDTDAYFILNCVVSPDLKDKDLLKAYRCVEPMDIIDKLFEPGEVSSISAKIMELAGYKKDIRAKLHEDLKN